MRKAAQRAHAEYLGAAVPSETSDGLTYFETVVTSAPIGMAVVDLESGVFKVNDALCRVTGQTRNAFEATTLHAITHPEDLDRQIVALGDRTLHITGSVGVAVCDGHGAAELLECADLAMYEAKAAGRNRIVVHRPGSASGKSIGDPRIAALVEKAVSDSGVDPACLIFELTEMAVITGFDEVQTFASRLSALGCRFALDDSAAGSGSFHYLERLPFDYFKIDGDLTRCIVTSSTEQLVIGAIVGIAQGMGKQTIAKFVADADTCGLLSKGGVDYVQGQYVNQPRPLSSGLPAV